MAFVVNQTTAVVGIARRAAERLRAGHLWVYRSEIERIMSAADGSVAESKSVSGGALVSVVDGRGIALGTALYSEASEIALRIVSRQPGVGRAEYLNQMKARVEAAIRLREAIVPEAFSRPGAGAVAGASSTTPGSRDADGKTNACRLVFSEADDLPGIVVDRYSELVVVQLLTQGTAQADVRATLSAVLAEQRWVTTVVERADARAREIERLAAPPAAPLFMRAGCQATTQTVFKINGVRFHFDAEAGQKTGAFLDQRLNYASAARWAGTVTAGRALDVCTYQGGFALHLARVCRRVTGVDASRAALEVADRNLVLNTGTAGKVDWIEADAFDLLRDYAAAGEQYDTVVLDPPAFAKSRRAVEGAIRGYKELNLRAMKMLSDGGILVTCSCSHQVEMEEFTAMTRAAAADAGRRVQVLEMRGAAPDHPAVLTLPETSYLKCLVCRVG